MFAQQNKVKTKIVQVIKGKITLVTRSMKTWTFIITVTKNIQVAKISFFLIKSKTIITVTEYKKSGQVKQTKYFSKFFVREFNF